MARQLRLALSQYIKMSGSSHRISKFQRPAGSWKHIRLGLLISMTSHRFNGMAIRLGLSNGIADQNGPLRKYQNINMARWISDRSSHRNLQEPDSPQPHLPGHYTMYSLINWVK